MDLILATTFEPCSFLDTLVKMNKIKTLGPNTAILHQIHRRIWPSAQRESLFWSQKLDVSEHRDSDAIDAHMVVNHDTEAVNVPVSAIITAESVHFNEIKVDTQTK